ACEGSSGSGQQLDQDAESLKLSDLLDRGWKIFEEVDSTNEPLSSSSVQSRVKRGMSMLEKASAMVAQLDLFSRNEELDEVSTADLKYLLLPALLGALTMKQTSRDKRLQTVQTAQVYFMDFLTRCKEYSVSQFDLPQPSNENMSPNGLSAATPVSCSSDLVSMAAQRQAKIERYRQKKELETRLSDVRKAVDSGQADDEVSRDFYL
ncbi:Immunoglobulin-binding protein 1, partial [Nibea albiflora]